MEPQLSRALAKKINDELVQAMKDGLQFLSEEVTRSIVEGSEITGAPGQPVSTGFLKTSWITEREDDGSFTVATNVAYAPVIEDNVRTAFEPQGVTKKREPGAGPAPKSTVGGSDSVKLTRAGYDKLVKVATDQAFAGFKRRLRT